MSERALTVGELLAYLSPFARDMPVVALYDCEMAGGSVVRVRVGPGVDDDRESVLLIVD